MAWKSGTDCSAMFVWNDSIELSTMRAGHPHIRILEPRRNVSTTEPTAIATIPTLDAVLFDRVLPNALGSLMDVALMRQIHADCSVFRSPNGARHLRKVDQEDWAQAGAF
jgi:hypothetical protein